MPDFTVIEGGGESGDKGREPIDWPGIKAKQAFEKLAIELLRALARGDDDGCRVTGALLDFLRNARETQSPTWELVHPVIQTLHERGLARNVERDSWEEDEKSILRAALQVAAKGMANDPAARGRMSKRRDTMHHALRNQEREQERRNREWASKPQLSLEEVRENLARRSRREKPPQSAPKLQ